MYFTLQHSLKMCALLQKNVIRPPIYSLSQIFKFVKPTKQTHNIVIIINITIIIIIIIIVFII